MGQPTPPIRMIATDIDGTMLRPDGTLSPAVRQALHEAAAAGIHVVPATGRPFIIATDILEALGLDEYWIFANGAVTWHHGRSETVRGFWMQPSEVRQIVERIRARLPGAGFAVEFDTEAIFESGFEQIVPVSGPLNAVDDVLEVLDRPVQKVLAFDHDTGVDQLYDSVAAAVEGVGVPSYSGLPFVEVAAALVTKAMAVAELAADLGVDQREVAAFGDYHNDVSMLRWAGRGYAMGNATDDAKAAADHVIGTNADDGLATQVRSLLEERRR